MVEFTLRNVTMILVVALVAGIALGCLGAFLHFHPGPPDPAPERDAYGRVPGQSDFWVPGGWFTPLEPPDKSFAEPLDPATIDPAVTGSSYTPFCPFGEDRGPGQGCLKNDGHKGAHMLFAPSSTGDDLDY